MKTINAYCLHRNAAAMIIRNWSSIGLWCYAWEHQVSETKSSWPSYNCATYGWSAYLRSVMLSRQETCVHGGTPHLLLGLPSAFCCFRSISIPKDTSWWQGLELLAEGCYAVVPCTPRDEQATCRSCKSGAIALHYRAVLLLNEDAKHCNIRLLASAVVHHSALTNNALCR